MVRILELQNSAVVNMMLLAGTLLMTIASIPFPSWDISSFLISPTGKVSCSLSKLYVCDELLFRLQNFVYHPVGKPVLSKIFLSMFMANFET